MYFVIYKYHETLSKCDSVILWVKHVFVTQLLTLHNDSYLTEYNIELDPSLASSCLNWTR